MSFESRRPSKSLSLSGERRVDEVCNRYEDAWRAGKRPLIEEYLSNVSGVEQPALLSELISLDVELRRTRGEDPRSSDYVQRFPRKANWITAFFAELPATQDVDQDAAATRAHVSESLPVDLTALAGKYFVHEEIGRGAMGRVYRATHRSFDMKVAIKVVSKDYSTRRFRREAECLVKVRSPHVVTVHDFVGLPDGSSVLVMEWIEGGDLNSAMQRNDGVLPEHLAIRWMRQTCEGMLAVEEQGIVHRDLKPANVMLDRKGQAKVADFGLARDPALDEQSGTVNLLGTPYYMSPEQAGNPRDVDTRSDIYSFGACFYHALTGHPPFHGESTFEILNKHKMEPLISPRARNPSLSETTNQLLERCLAKSPDERFQSFGDILAFFKNTPPDLDRALAEYLSVYLASYHSRRLEYLSRQRAKDVPDVYEFPDGRTLSIAVGDLIKQDVEAIVSADDWLVTMSSGIAKAVLQAAGNEIRAELRCTPLRPGRVIVTTGGKLKAQRIFHAVVKGGSERDSIHPSHDVISEVMRSCLYQAESFFVSSIAFPLVGAESDSFTEEACLDTVFRFLADSLLRGVTTIRDARIVLNPSTRTEHMPKMRRPVVTGYRFSEHFLPAPDIVGDFLDYISLSGGRIAMVVADVAGHGVPAAATVRELSQVTRAYLAGDSRVEKAMEYFNQYLCQLKMDRYVTMILAVFDPTTHQLALANAGQVPPVWRRRDGRVEFVGESQVGIPLGIRPEQHYEPFVMTISPGEAITMVSDGATEARNASGRRFGTKGVLDQVAAVSSDSEEIVTELVSNIQQLIDGPLFDALCVLSFNRV